ncbi:hypothetical protein HQ571_06880 [Candidatus Kuenenbacteria bacterium]|nr:hypothetical protein [Candidatus Kuenenbacteria bacterium]
MYDAQLQTLGLSKKQAMLYEVILGLGASTITPILETAKLKKGDAYNVLRQLEDIGLITEIKKPGNKTLFQANPPQELQKIIKEKQEKLDLQRNGLGEILPALTSLFQSATEKPVIQIFKGYRETETFYKDLLTTKTPLCIISSFHYKDDPEHKNLIFENVKQRVRLGIKARVINHPKLELNEKELTEYLQLRKQAGVEVRFIPEKFKFPSRIIVYDNKIAITSLKKELITTLIENENIAITFRLLFEYMWGKAKEDHKKITNNL